MKPEDEDLLLLILCLVAGAAAFWAVLYGLFVILGG